MRLANKHANVQTVTYADFTGGLNTNDTPENIQQNELSKAVNIEMYKGQLKTVAGTTRIYYQEDGDFSNLIYDSLENIFLLVDSSGKVYKLEGESLTEVGTLTGQGNVVYVAWESGVLIASGGKLQYYHNGTLETISTSPDVCNGVFIKSGRVWVYFNDRLQCSGVGDETQWEHDSNDESKSQWLDIGYKDGGVILGVTTLSSDTVIFKSNSHAYHLAGDFPSWQVREIGRQITCKCYNACVALVNNAIVVGETNVQAIGVTDSYGDMQASNIASKVYGDISALPRMIKPRYIPQLNQIWLLQNDKKFIFYDANVGGWYYRKFNSAVMDAVEANNVIYVLKPTGLCFVDTSHMTDEGEDMQWSFRLQNLLANNRYLIKRVNVDTTPLHSHYCDERIRVGSIGLEAAQPDSAYQLYDNDAYLFESQLPLMPSGKNTMYSNSEELYNSQEYIYESDLPLMSTEMYRASVRCVDNKKSVQVRGDGAGGVTIFNNVSFDITEV